MPIGHIPNFHYTLHRELTELYASVAIRNFALGLIAIFEPIYIFLFFRDTLSLPHAISLALVFFAISSLVHAFMYPVGSKILSAIGVKHTMLLSIPILALYYVGLWQIEALGLFVFALPLLTAIAGGIYWPSFHLDFAHFTRRGERGKQISYRSIVVSVASAASPLLGGILITFLGFPVLFGLVFGLLLFSIVPLFLSSEIHEVNHPSIAGAFRDAFGKKYRPQMLGFAASTFDSTVALYIWPIFLFTIAISFESLGIIMTGSMVMGLLFVLYLGRIVDKRGPIGIFKVGVWLNTFVWPIRIFVQTPFDVFLAQTIHGFMRRTTYLPRNVLSYDWIDQQGPQERMKRIIARGISLNGSNAVSLLIFAAIFFFVPILPIAFVLAALTVPFNLIFLKGLEAN